MVTIPAVLREHKPCSSYTDWNREEQFSLSHMLTKMRVLSISAKGKPRNKITNWFHVSLVDYFKCLENIWAPGSFSCNSPIWCGWMEAIVTAEFLEIFLGTKESESWLADNQISNKDSQSTKDGRTMTLKLQDEQSQGGDSEIPKVLIQLGIRENDCIFKCTKHKQTLLLSCALSPLQTWPKAIIRVCSGCLDRSSADQRSH